MKKLNKRTIPKAVRALKKQDKHMAKIIKKVGACKLEVAPYKTHFEFVARAIIFQQLSGKAATTIYNRMLKAIGGKMTPQAIAKATDEALQGAGVSRQKLGYLRDLARHAVEKLVDFEGIEAKTDDEIIEELTKVKGVGRWTAQMFLMFQLGSPDVLSELDLGLQKGIQKLFGRKELPKPKEVLEIGKAWTPYRSIASWYLWQSLESAEKK